MQPFLYEFSSQASSDRRFEVLKFHGREEVDACFEFTVLVQTGLQGFVPEKLLSSYASLTINQGQASILKTGCVKRLRVLGVKKKHLVIEITLAPTLQRLELGRNSRTFVDSKLSSILKQVLKSADISNKNCEFRLSGEDPVRPYECQHEESDLSFFRRLLHQFGWSFFFEFSDETDKLVICDTLGQRQDLPQGADELRLSFSPPGTRPTEAVPLALHFTDKVTAIPAKIKLKDWNYEHPNVALEAEQDVKATGFGRNYAFGHSPGTSQGIADTAKCWAEGLAGLANRNIGTSNTPLLLPCQQCSLEDHPVADMNKDYIPLFVEHWGRSAGENTGEQEIPDAQGYRNRFVAIGADRPYRLPPPPPTPYICGGVHARVEGETETYAHLDEQGRYRVKMGFDNAERPPCKSSAPVRLMSPHAGPGYGLHMPLLANTEVLMGHEGGHPARPLIMGVLPNVHAVGPIDQKTTTQANMVTAGGNKLKFEDKKDSSGLFMHSPVSKASISIGAMPSTLAAPNECAFQDLQKGQEPPSSAASGMSKLSDAAKKANSSDGGDSSGG